MPTVKDRVKDTTTTTGTGTITVSGSPASGYQALSTITTGTEIEYVIAAQSGGKWETGRGVVASGTTFSRDQVYDGSGGVGVAVSFDAGTKDVAIDLTARQAMRANPGRQQSYRIWMTGA